MVIIFYVNIWVISNLLNKDRIRYKRYKINFFFSESLYCSGDGKKYIYWFLLIFNVIGEEMGNSVEVSMVSLRDSYL